MSYSFTVRAADKAAAKAAVAAEFDRVVKSQPIHAKDRDAAQAAAYGMIEVLTDDPARDVTAQVYGSVSYNYVAGGAVGPISASNVSASASLVTRKPHP